MVASENNRTGSVRSVTQPAAALDREEEALWRSLVEIVARLPRALDDNFARETGVNMTEYAILVALSEAADRELRMGDLATATALSRSRVTRVIDDMTRRSLVRRRKSDADGRGSVATLTDEGIAILEKAHPGHLARVRALVLDHLTRGEIRVMTQAFDRVSTALREVTD
jgi:DNA-binding MarR family transcriptional regulator